MNYTHIANTPTYTPLNYTYTCADISKEQKQLARIRLEDSVVVKPYWAAEPLYKFDGKHYSLRSGK